MDDFRPMRRAAAFAIFFIFARLPLTHDVSLFIGDPLLHGQPLRLKRLDIKVGLL